MRKLSDQFLCDLQSEKLNFFLCQAQTNSNISLEIRNGYINLYYKGGSALKISEHKNGYTFHFDSKYCKNKGDDSKYSFIDSLNKKDDLLFKKHFPLLLSEMDSWFRAHPKPERGYQQHLIKNNTNAPLVIDIEYAGKTSSNRQFRLDMVGYFDDKLIIFENKYGNGAITGASGIKKHYDDIVEILNNEKTKSDLIQCMISISNQKNKLGLSDFILADVKDVEIWFIFTNFNEKSQQIKKEINKISKSIAAKYILLYANETKINPSNLNPFI